MLPLDFKSEIQDFIFAFFEIMMLISKLKPVLVPVYDTSLASRGENIRNKSLIGRTINQEM